MIISPVNNMWIKNCLSDKETLQIIKIIAQHKYETARLNAWGLHLFVSHASVHKELSDGFTYRLAMEFVNLSGITASQLQDFMYVNIQIERIQKEWHKRWMSNLDKRLNPLILYITEPAPTMILSKRHITKPQISQSPIYRKRSWMNLEKQNHVKW